MGPRFLYLHGFASGPRSSKGMQLSQRFEKIGVTLERLDLRRPSLEELSLRAMMDEVQRAIGGERDRAVLFGSSLGATTAVRVAERDARVCALVLLAPAFKLGEEWPKSLGPEKWSQWLAHGMEIDDYVEARKTRVHAAFAHELAALDVGYADVRVPTLIVHGRGDTVVDIALSREFARTRRHVRLVEADDAHELSQSVDLIEREARAFLEPLLNLGAADARAGGAPPAP